MDLSNKFQTVKDIIDEVIISERRGIEVYGHIPLPIQKLGYETECGNSQDTTRLSLPFEFKIKLPSPRIARQIIERDRLGRIQVTVTPEASY